MTTPDNGGLLYFSGAKDRRIFYKKQNSANPLERIGPGNLRCLALSELL